MVGFEFVLLARGVCTGVGVLYSISCMGLQSCSRQVHVGMVWFCYGRAMVWSCGFGLGPIGSRVGACVLLNV